MVLTSPPARPSSRAKAYRRPRRRTFWIRRAVLAVVLVTLVATGWSLAGALRAPGDDAPTKLAEWARDHGLGPIVTLAETVQYRLNPPVTGGSPDTAQLAAGAREAVTGARTGTAAIPQVLLQQRVTSPAGAALPGEGVWVPAVRTAAGPLVQVTYVRPDTVHTSYLTGIAWMSHRLHFVLHPGFEDPGTTGLSQADAVTRSHYAGLAATFNGGFKMKDAGGGYYDHGTTIGALAQGAASFVVYRDGHATVGTWGGDVSMTPDVVFVRQNLKPLVQDGTVAPNLDANVQGSWGVTVGGGMAVWRSGIGVTAAGDLVYAGGNALTVSALADVLHRAGAVQAMQLDINPAWVSYMFYSRGQHRPVPHKLVPFQRPADRYLSATSRDFVAAYLP